MRAGARWWAQGLAAIALISLSEGQGIAGQITDASAPLRPLDVPDVLNVRTLHGGPAFHPYDDLVALPLSRRGDAPAPQPGADPHFLYSVDHGGVPTSENASRVVIIDLRDGTERDILPGASRSWAPTWSPDGRKLAFLSDEGGQIGLWIWDRQSSTARAVDLPATPMVSILSPPPVWLPDSRRILVPTRNATSPDYARGITSSAARDDGIDIFSSPDETGSAAIVGSGFAARLHADLSLADLDEGSATIVLRDVTAIGLWAAPDGRWLAIENALGSGMATQRLRSRLSFLDLETGATVTLQRHVEAGYGPLTASWSLDGGQFVFLNEGGIKVVSPSSGTALTTISAPPGIQTIGSGELVAEGQGLFALVNTVDGASRRASRLLQVDLRQNAMRSLASSDELEFLGLVRAARGQAGLDQATILARDVRTQEAVILGVESDGALGVMQRGHFAFSSSTARRSVSGDGTFFALLERPDQPTDIWRLGASREHRTRVSQLNEALANVAFAAPRLVHGRSENGSPLTGILLVPPQWREGQRCPLVVRPYGDQRPARLLYRFGLSGGGVENLQLLASRGYAVLVPELPITPNEPLASVRARVGEMLLAARDTGIVDARRMGVFGHSFGGYAAISLITDERSGFRSAVVTAPVGLNLFSYYGFLDRNGASGFVGWTEDGQARVGANPWNDPGRLVANSPLLQIDQTQGPVLIIQGAADQPRVPQSNELFVGLRRLGQRAEYRLYSGEPHWHGEWSATNAANYLHSMLNWFDATLADTGGVALADPNIGGICT